MDHSEVKANVQEQFGKNAQGYVTSKSHAKGKDLAKLVERAEVDTEMLVLDIATGGGHVANALAPLTAKVVALDLTSEILEAAKKFIESNGHKNVEFVQGDAEKLPFPDEKFDMVTCRIAAHHFPNPQSFVKEAFRTLKKDGKFLLIDNVAPEKSSFDTFYNQVEKDRDYSHHRAWKKSEWLQMLEYAGFEIEETYRFTKTFIFENWCKRMNLPEEKQMQLSTYMLQATQELKNKFRIKEVNQKVYSFNGESIFIKAIKPSFI
ncbi:methyltransferase domain-containing protein [Bacillaceae bacterium Marseille-Q3522]|nr:methyltransferase domain-containing protein [Bacillaceae bacterium Marseille-Q3522]